MPESRGLWLGVNCGLSSSSSLSPKNPSKVPVMTLQLLDFCLSILTLCSSYMEVPTYLNFKSMNHMVSPGPGPTPLAGCVALSTWLPLSVPQGLGWAGLLRSGAWEEGSFTGDLLRVSAWEEPRKGG